MFERKIRSPHTPRLGQCGRMPRAKPGSHLMRSAEADRVAANRGRDDGITDEITVILDADSTRRCYLDNRW
ncbi:hypothetical protein WG66_013853 [Moniliophthora roreri]|nr:hypothetical protein WG66_013853 [Moniliophthora roreri]